MLASRNNALKVIKVISSEDAEPLKKSLLSLEFELIKLRFRTRELTIRTHAVPSRLIPGIDVLSNGVNT